MGVRIRGTLGDIEPLNKVPFKRAKSGVQKGLGLLGGGWDSLGFRRVRLRDYGFRA